MMHYSRWHSKPYCVHIKITTELILKAFSIIIIIDLALSVSWSHADTVCIMYTYTCTHAQIMVYNII